MLEDLRGLSLDLQVVLHRSSAAQSAAERAAFQVEQAQKGLPSGSPVDAQLLVSLLSEVSVEATAVGRAGESIHTLVLELPIVLAVSR